MIDLIKIISKVLVREFYRSHVTFFLLVGGIAGGFMRSEDHLALAALFVSSPLLLAIPIFCWLGYVLMIYRFNTQHMALKQNEFTYSLIQVKPIKQWLVILFSALEELAPVLLYSFLLLYVSWRDSKWVSAFLILLSLVTLVYFIGVRLRHTFFGRSEGFFFVHTRMGTFFTRPFFLFFVEWIARRDLLQFALAKLFSLLLLFAIAYVYTTDSYDDRLLLLGIAMVGGSQSHFVWQLHRFDNYWMTFTKNLPIPIWRRQVGLLTTLIILMSPELGLIISRYSTLTDFGSALTYCILLLSIPMFLYGFLFSKEREPDQLAPLTFFLGIVYILLILYKIPPLILGLINVLAGAFFFHTRFYHFEYTAKSKREGGDDKTLPVKKEKLVV